MRTFVRDSHELVSVRVGSGEIKATPEHPFWVVGRGWVEAGKLRAGDRVLNSGGRPEVVRQVEGLKVPAGGVRVYNFEVEDLHTYYVLAGQTPVLVHNSCGPALFIDEAQFGKNGGSMRRTMGLTLVTRLFVKFFAKK